MNEIYIYNNYSYLKTDNKEIQQKLWILFRFRKPDFYHNPAFKSKKWDGFYNFYDKEKGKFLTGLLGHVLYTLKNFDETYTLIDKREPFQFVQKSIKQDFLNDYIPEDMSNFKELHDFQPDLVNQVIKNKRGLIDAATGAGKSIFLISLLKCFPPKTPILVTTGSGVSLTQQLYDDLINWKVPNVGRWYGNYKDPNYITVALANKHAFKGLGKLLPKFKALIVDEVHNKGLSPVPTRAYDKMTNAIIRVGISATPFKDNGKDQVEKYKTIGYFGPRLKTTTTKSGRITTSDLQKRGILSASRCTFFPIRYPDLSYEPFQDAVTLGLSKNLQFLDQVRKLAKATKGRTLILVERIEQGVTLKELLPEAHWVYGNVKIEDRLPVLKDLKYKDNVIAIVMQKIISDGVNIFIHNLINAAGGQAHHSIVQRLGRGLRLANDKNILDYYDFIFYNNPYLLKHSEKRIKVIQDEGHELIIKDNFDIN